MMKRGKKYTKKFYAYCPRSRGIGIGIGMEKNIAYMLQEMKYLLRGTRMSKVVEKKIIKRVTHWATRLKNQSDHIHWQFVSCCGAAEREKREKIEEITTAAAFIWRHFYWKVILNECLIALVCMCVKHKMIVFVVHLWCCKSESFSLMLA